MEADLKSEDKEQRSLYFFIQDGWKNEYFCGLFSNIKFGVYLFVD